MKVGKDTWVHFVHCFDTSRKVNKSWKLWFTMLFSLWYLSNAEL